MTDKTQTTIIMDTSDEAAQPHTMSGWKSAKGHFYAEESMARYDGCTHRACKYCGKPAAKSWLACTECRAQKDQEKYDAMPKVEWDGVAMLYSETLQQYFTGLQDAQEYVDDEEGWESKTLRDLNLVICDPQFVHCIDPEEYYCDTIPEDGGIPVWLEDAFEQLNKIIVEHEEDPISWYPGKTALKLPEKKEETNVAVA